MQAAAATGALTAVRLAWPFRWGVRTAYAFSQSPGLRKWVTALRGVGPGGIPVAAPDATPAPVTGVTHYTIGIAQFADQLHPDMGPTTLWGYNPTVPLGGGIQPQKHLGGLIVAQKGAPIQITFRNNLPGIHILPVDLSIMGANLGSNRVAVHLHGGHVPWISDGGPHDWFDPAGRTGMSFLNNTVLNPGAAPNEGEYFYPNDQSARLVWYHDHAWGITRLNAYAGIATGYIIRDAFEASLRDMGLPDFVENGGRELPLVIQDKIFVGPNTLAADPTWPGPTTPGSLWYAHVYEPKLYKLTGNKAGPGSPPDPSVVPEFFGDTMLANGTVYPETTVEARRYRLRVLNACQARFLNLQLYVDDGSPDSITLNPATMTPVNAKGPDFLQIGAEAGFLPQPVLIPSNQPFNVLTLGGSLILAPAERADLIIDFRGFEGKKLVLYNDAPAPFPTGSPLNDYFSGNPLNPTQPFPGSGPNTRQIMRFNVVAAHGKKDKPLAITATTNLQPGNDPLLVPLGVTTPPSGVAVRQLTLNEGFDEFSRLIQLEGTNVPANNKGTGFGRMYLDPATETPSAGSMEVWQIANLTGDTHPIHFHLVNVQVISRQPFRASNYGGTPSYLGPAVPPDPNEAGWKETVRMNPGEVTTVIMRFDLPVVPFPVPSSPRTGGNEYVWHCHILEHEEHDMMRPLIVT